MLKNKKTFNIILLIVVGNFNVIFAGECLKKQDSSNINVGGQKQLFIDNLFFESSSNIKLKLNPALKTGEKNLIRDKEWESATPNWFTVMEDQGKYRMWYEAYDVKGWPTGDDTSFCYAESTDGIKWTKPVLGLFEYQGSKENNILFRQIGPEGAYSRVHGVCVFKDEKASPDQRYKGVSQGVFPGENGFETSWGGTMYNKIAGMYSPDGIHWTRYPKSISNEFADSQNSGFWDDRIGKYVIYGRACDSGRTIGRSESSDFSSFEKLSVVLNADANDPADSDLYNPTAMKYPYADNIYLMFTSLFQHGPQTLDVRLAVSRDGIHWTYPEQDKAFIPLGKKGEFDSGSIYMGQGVLKVGDELWQYYGGSPLNHAEGELEALVKPGNGRVFSRVVTRLDGYVSVEADSTGGSFTTPPLIFEGNILKLNAGVRDGGHIRVGLLDESGNPIEWRSVEDCLPITGNHISTVVMWKSDGDVSTRAGKPTKLAFEIKNASLYSFQFSKGYPYKIK